MHAFGLVRERMHHVGASSQSHPDFLRFSKPAITLRFLLAGVGEAVAPPAREQLAGTIQHRDPASAVSPSGMDGTDEPRPTATKITGLGLLKLFSRARGRTAEMGLRGRPGPGAGRSQSLEIRAPGERSQEWSPETAGQNCAAADQFYPTDPPTLFRPGGRLDVRRG
jgi:hypothetical protein